MVYVLPHFFWDLSVILIVICGQPSGFYNLGVLAGTPFAKKHFPWVWQLEQNKRLLFTSYRSASHNTQLTACSFVIHSQELGVSQIREINMASFTFYSFCAHTTENRMCLMAERETHISTLTCPIHLPFLKQHLSCEKHTVSAVLIIT